MERYELVIQAIQINEKWIRRIQIDDHVKKHGDITTELIVSLVKNLNGTKFDPEECKKPFNYFSTCRWFKEKQYRIVWVFEDSRDYIGIITVFRDKKVRSLWGFHQEKK